MILVIMTSGGARYRILLEDVGPSPRERAKSKAREEPKQRGTQGSGRLNEEFGDTKESFRDILEEKERKHELALEQLTATRDAPRASAAALKVMHAELEASAAELRALLEESKQRQQRLRESEARVRALLETAAQGILAVERNGRIGMVNRTAETMFGYRREDLLGQPVEMLLPESLRGLHRQHRREFFTHPRTRPMGQGLDLFARRKDGTTFPVEISLSHIEAEGGAVAVAFISDITERKRAEAQLRLQAAITANMTEGISLVRTRDAVIAYANERYHELFGYEPGELHGKPVTVLNAGTKAEAKATAQEIMKVLNRDRQWSGEVRNVRKNGSIFWSSTAVSTLEHEEYGTVWLGVLRDVTARKQAEEALRRSHGELRSLTARLTALQEEQYKHLARELHDVFSQKLTVLGMQVGELEHRLSESGLAPILFI